MANLVVLDAGPLVALIDSADFHHAWATEQVSQIRDDFITCEAVISECYFLVRRNPVGIATLLAYLDEGWSASISISDPTSPPSQP